MLTRRSLEIDPSRQGLSQPLVPRDILTDAGLAEHLLDVARSDAEYIREQAHQQSEALLAETQAQCWKIAEAAHQQWQAQRQAMWAGIEGHARELVNQALAALLGEATERSRTDAVLHQIVKHLADPVSAWLYAHPDEIEAIEALILQREEAVWTVRPDPTLARDQLRLVTDAGVFELDWNNAVRALLLPAAQT